VVFAFLLIIILLCFCWFESFLSLNVCVLLANFDYCILRVLRVTMMRL